MTGSLAAAGLAYPRFPLVTRGKYLFWAFFYNVAMIPLAIMGWMHPALAEIAMATSSVTVVSNANLLRRVNIHPSYFMRGE